MFSAIAASPQEWARFSLQQAWSPASSLSGSKPIPLQTGRANPSWRWIRHRQHPPTADISDILDEITAPLSFPGDRPHHQHLRGQVRHRDQERYLQRAAVRRTFSRESGFSGRAVDRGMAQTAGTLCVLSRMGRVAVVARNSLFSDHRQGQVSKAGSARGHDRVSRDQKSPGKKNMWWLRGEAKVAGHLVAEPKSALCSVRSGCRQSIHPPGSIRARRSGGTYSIGPFCVIGPNVVIGDGSGFLPCAMVGIRLSAREPRSTRLSCWERRRNRCISRWTDSACIGAGCDIRENVTMNTGTEGGGADRSG